MSSKAAVASGVVSKPASGVSGCASCGSAGPVGASAWPAAVGWVVADWGVGVGEGVVLGVICAALGIGSSGALMSPDSGGSAALNSASGTIGPSPGAAAAGAPGTGVGVAPSVGCGLGASGPRAGAVPGLESWASAGEAASKAAVSQ